MLHSLSLAKYEDLPDKDARVGVKIARPKPQTERFINLRTEMPNVLFSTEDWNKQANKLTAIEEPTCFNKFKHVEPKVFEDAATLRQHTDICFGKVAAGVQVIAGGTADGASACSRYAVRSWTYSRCWASGTAT